MTKLRFNTLAALLLCACNASALMPIRWIADGSKADAYATQIAQGETRDLICTLKNYGAPVALPDSATATLFYQTNGMGSAYWEAPATVTTNGVITATWSPALDAGATVYSFALGVDDGSTNRIYTAYGILRMRLSPGHIPNTLPLPRQSLDLATVDVLNAPWATMADVASAVGAVVEADPVAYPVATNALAVAKAHAVETANPHHVTAAQVGALEYDGTAAAASKIQIDPTSWITMLNGNGTLFKVINTSNVTVISSYGSGPGYPFNGPEIGTTWMFAGFDGPIGQWSPSAGWAMSSNGSGPGQVISSTGQPWSSQESEAPFMLNPLEYPEDQGIGQFIVDWIYITNSVPIATLFDIDNSISNVIDTVQALRGIHADVATNVVYHVVVSNGHWLIQEVQ